MTQLTDEQYWKLADSVYDDKWLNINNITTLSIDELKKLETINANDGSKGSVAKFKNKMHYLYNI